MAIFPIASDKAQLTTEAVDALDNYACGILTDSLDTKARAWPTGGTVYQNGFLFTPSGQVVYVDATSSLPTGTTYHNGLPYAPTGELCISTDATVYWSNGLPFVANGALSVGNNLYGAPSFQVNLITSLIQQLGTGSPTFTRADATPCATHTDFEGVVRVVPANCARFAGARFVQNLYTGSATLGTQGVTTKAGDHTVSFTGTGTITFTGTYTGSLVGQGASTRVGMTFTATAGTLTSTVSGSVTNGQLEYVQGQTNKNPSEYVDSATSYGAGVVGIAYFATLNGNTVSANVVTSGTGAAIKQGVVGSDISTGVWVTDANCSYASGVLTFAGSAVGTGANQINVPVAASSSYTVTYTVTITTGSVRVAFGGSYLDTAKATSGTYTTTISGVGTNTLTFVAAAAGTIGTISNISVKQLLVSPSAPVDASGPLGYLSEGSRQNIILQSEDFTTTWTPSANNSISPNVATAPNGTLTADSIFESDTVTTFRYARQDIAKAASALQYTFSYYAKAGTRTWSVLTIYDGANGNRLYTNLSTGAIGSNTVLGTGFTGISWVTANAGNGWWKISATFTTTTSTVLQIYPSSATADNTGNYAGVAATTAIYVWGAQLEQAAFASTYIPTAASAVTRAADSGGYPLAGNFSDTSGTMYAEVNYAAWANAVGSIMGSATQGMLPLATNNGVRGFDGTNTVNGTAGTPSGMVKMAVSWIGSTMTVCANGTTPVSGAYDGSWNLATLNIGLGAFCTIRNVRVYPTALSNAQLTALTTP